MDPSYGAAKSKGCKKYHFQLPPPYYIYIYTQQRIRQHISRSAASKRNNWLVDCVITQTQHRMLASWQTALAYQDKFHLWNLCVRKNLVCVSQCRTRKMLVNYITYIKGMSRTVRVFNLFFFILGNISLKKSNFS